MSKIPSVVWYRAKNTCLDDDCSTSVDSPDALRFRAKIDCNFTGLVWTKNMSGQAFKLIVQYRISMDEDNNYFGELSEKLEIDST
jgi:hypothetical protein